MEDTDAIVAMGDYCETLLMSDQFNTLVNLFEAGSVKTLLSTKPADKDKREDMYAVLNGLREFLGYAKEFVDARDKLLAPPIEDHSDDPSVHDIYRPD